MAKKKKIEDPEMQISSDHEEVESSSEEDMQKSGSESESEEGSESEDDMQKPVPDNFSGKPKIKEVRKVNTPVVKPAVSLSEETPSKKPVAITTKNKGVLVAASKSASKRPGMSPETSSPMKRARNESGDVDIITADDAKKPNPQRVWTENDEITLLDSMIKLNGKNHNLTGFFDSVRNDFSFVPSNSQFVKKMSALKIKYQNKKYKGDKVNDIKSMGLAEQIWGPGGFLYESTNSLLKSNIGKSRKSEKKKVQSSKPVEEDVLVRARGDMGVKRDWFEASFFVPFIVSLGLDEDYVKQRWSSVSMEDKKELEEAYKLWHDKYVVENARIKTMLLHKATSLIFKSS
ncbi:hypothetical protein AALP_AA6G207000 [Arabis alpina]|uniref:Uncharacterized protein n=1 Tax=Arabis alpina TaxID=50452 RepID=A0A087GQM0_ARAAL|nr:hypothetical protein AALP_AA6G207000 [Arabis alpina]